MCKTISKYQLRSDVLLEHQQYILNSGCLGLAQYYTLQGSYFMNQYLRKLTKYDERNDYLEELIRGVWKTVISAPEFDNDYFIIAKTNKK